MADYDYPESGYEKLKQEAQRQGEPSSEEIEMTMPSYSRRNVVPPRRFPSQDVPAALAPADPQHSDATAEADESLQQDVPEHSESTDIEPEASAPERDETELDHEAEAHQEEELPVEEVERGEHSVRDTATTTTGSTESSVSSTGASAPEAHPQRDEPDDGEHTESAPAPIAAAPAVEEELPPPPAPVTPEPLVDPPSPTEPAEIVTASASRVQPPDGAASKDKPWLSSPGTHPVSYADQVYFSPAGETIIMKKIPRSMIDLLRTKVATIVGGDFADRIPGHALLTAFTAVKLGFAMDVDENTAAAMRAFEMMEPRLDAIEEHAAEISRDIVMMAEQMTKFNKKMGSMERATRALEWVQAFAFTDRVLGGVDGADDTAESIRLNAPQVAHTKKLLRKEADEVYKQEQEREGRGIHQTRGS